MDTFQILDTDKQKELIDYIITSLPDFEGTEIQELHHNLFNTNYYIIDTYQAKQWLSGIVFDAFEAIKEYESFHFGEVNSDFSNAKHVVNMFIYIVGEEILYELDSYQDYMDDELTGEIIDEMITELKEL